MKKILRITIVFGMILSLPGLYSYSQVCISKDDSPPDNSAMLDIKSTNSGFLEPRMTEAQRNAINNPATGLMIYQTDGITGFYHYNGSAWTTDLIQPQFACGVDSTLIGTAIKLPLGYSQGIVIDTIIFVSTTTASGGTVNVTAKVQFGTDISATGTSVINAGTTIMSKAQATRRGAAAMDNITVEKGNMIWLIFSEVTTPPKNFMVQIIGHKL